MPRSPEAGERTSTRRTTSRATPGWRKRRGRPGRKEGWFEPCDRNRVNTGTHPQPENLDRPRDHLVGSLIQRGQGRNMSITAYIDVGAQL